eukprot:jgi/Mesen1/10363/ME000080S09755
MARLLPRGGTLGTHTRHLLSTRLKEALVLLICGCMLVIVFPFLSISGTLGDWLGSSSEAAACGGEHVGPGTSSLYFVQRQIVYDKMQADFKSKGPAFLAKGLSDIFEKKGGAIRPVLKPATPPVRATVLYFEPRVASSIERVVRRVLEANFTGGVWYQDPAMYHSSLHHASHHMQPIRATSQQVDEEAASVKELCRRAVPVRVALDRVVLTATGVLLGCWQVLDGTDPAELRDRLKKALPRSPSKQLYNRVMLHTSFARVLGPPNLPEGGTARTPEEATPVLRTLVDTIGKELCRTQTTIREMWYVEEMDLLALALNGSMRTRSFPLEAYRPVLTKHVVVPG